MITTRELARLAGVSQATVSRSLNDRPEISSDTKERIRALARENGYIVRQKKNKTVCSPKRKVIGILVMRYDFFESIFINALINELNTAIEQENYYSMPIYDCYGETGVDRLRDLLNLDIIEGFIIINRHYNEVIAQYFEQIRIPHIYLIYHLRNSTKQAYVFDSDNFAGGYMATKHLLELGHHRIAVITSPLSEIKERAKGYTIALQEAGIDYDPSLVLVSDVDYDSTYKLVSDSMDLFKNDATAIFVQYDIGAIAAMSALYDRGVSVPKEVSVIGFDGLYLGEIYRPKLTSIQQPIHELVNQAFLCLQRIINAPQSQHPTKLYMKPTLVVRSSTAPPLK